MHVCVYIYIYIYIYIYMGMGKVPKVKFLLQRVAVHSDRKQTFLYAL
jgi:hypothetical protein